MTWSLKLFLHTTARIPLLADVVVKNNKAPLEYTPPLRSLLIHGKDDVVEADLLFKLIRF